MKEDKTIRSFIPSADFYAVVTMLRTLSQLGLIKNYWSSWISYEIGVEL